MSARPDVLAGPDALGSSGGRARPAVLADRRFFLLMALAALVFSVGGFARTYYFSFWTGAPPLKAMVHVHAAAFTAWVVLLVGQVLLIRTRHHRLHRMLGQAAVALVVVMVVTGYMVILGKSRPTPGARAFIFTPMLSLLLFPAFFAAAIHLRRDMATHKRLMLLATSTIAGAGVVRLLALIGVPPGQYTHHVLTYGLLIGPLVVYDLVRSKKLHPATAWGSALLLARHPLHYAVSNTDTWQRIAAWLTPPV